MDFFSPADLPGHLSYVLIAISYYATNIYWLRVTAVIGLALEILYFQLSRGAMHTGIVWNLVFILINIYQLHVLLRERDDQIGDAVDVYIELYEISWAGIGGNRMQQFETAVAVPRRVGHAPGIPGGQEAQQAPVRLRPRSTGRGL